MDKAKIYNTIKEVIYDHLSRTSFNLIGDTYDDRDEFEIALEGGYVATVTIRVDGYNYHNDGDWYGNVPSDSGLINAYVEELTLWDEEENKVLCEKNVSELSTKYEY